MSSSQQQVMFMLDKPKVVIIDYFHQELGFKAFDSTMNYQL